ncbi:uncharacterized protein LODBEIA_P37400 [Lodderomyces beijingensis]|uniref:Uncharacterized protein n=1 Tax=Lodderomyces beijingensis TaxID=1775926 RepID=A0ABP0ZR13_9ASCO
MSPHMSSDSSSFNKGGHNESSGRAPSDCSSNSSSHKASRWKTRNYQPRFLQQHKQQHQQHQQQYQLGYQFSLSSPPNSKLIALPSVESFQLDSIINELRPHSDAVSEHLLKVAKHYKDDLRQSVKNKLSFEQKIQFLNINVCRTSQKTKSLVHRSRKSVAKLTSEDENLGVLLENSVLASRRTRALIDRLAASKHVQIDRDKYPHLSRLMAASAPPQAQETNDRHSLETSPPSASPSPLPMSPSNVPYEIEADKEALNPTFERGEENILAVEASVSLMENHDGSSSKENRESKTTKSDEISLQSPLAEQLDQSSSALEPQFQPAGVVILDGTTPEDEHESFEGFISTTVSKFREFKAQARNHQTSHSTAASTDTAPSVAATASSPNTAIRNPLALLYSSILKTHPIQQQEINSYPFLIKKAGPTWQSSSHHTHHKKLRINGDLLDTAYYQKQQDKKQKQIQDEENEGENEGEIEGEVDNGHDPDKKLAQEMKHPNELDGTWMTSPSPPSPSSRSPSLSSSSSSSDDSSLDELLPVSQQASKRLQSPTPKHQPSHHSLQPSRSILKHPKKPRRKSNHEHRAKVAHQLDSELENDPLLQVNKAFGSRSNSITTDYTAIGEIAEDGAADTVSKLKSFV